MTNVKPLRELVPFAFIFPNADNPGLKDFSPAVRPADAPDDDDEAEGGTGASGGEARDDSDPKVSPSSAPESAPTSPSTKGEVVKPENPETPASAEKGSLTKEEDSKE